jgi:hypothetical protein
MLDTFGCDLERDVGRACGEQPVLLQQLRYDDLQLIH